MVGWHIHMCLMNAEVGVVAWVLFDKVEGESALASSAFPPFLNAHTCARVSMSCTCLQHDNRLPSAA